MPGCLINDTGKMIALEIEDEVIEAIRASNGQGISIKDCSRIIDIPYNDCYRAIYALENMHKVKVARASKGMCIILPEWEEPFFITARQKVVLQFMSSLMDHNSLIRISYRSLSAELVRSGVSSKKTYAHDVVECLDRKGYLTIVESGNSSHATLYRVYPDRDGPRGYSWRGRTVSAAR